MSRELQIDDEFENLIPPSSEDEFSRLEKSILAEGVREPIITCNGVIVDGHNRYKICQKHALVCPRREMEFPSRDAAKIWIIENQLGRRNLLKYNSVALALKLKPLYEAEAKRRQATSTGGAHPQLSQKSDEPVEPMRTDERIAQAAGVSRDTVRKVEAIKTEADKGNPVAIQVDKELSSGEKKSIHGAYVSVVGKPKPRKPSDMVTEDGRIKCVMCGEPINEGEAHAARPTVHKKCEREYQRDWEKDKADTGKSLLEIEPVFDRNSLIAELNGSAKMLETSWMQSLEINEGMGVKLAEAEKQRLYDAVDCLYRAIENIKKEG